MLGLSFKQLRSYALQQLTKIELLQHEVSQLTAELNEYIDEQRQTLRASEALKDDIIKQRLGLIDTSTPASTQEKSQSLRGARWPEVARNFETRQKEAYWKKKAEDLENSDKDLTTKAKAE